MGGDGVDQRDGAVVEGHHPLGGELAERDRTAAFAAACDAAGISVRPFDGEGARVSIGTPEANDAFLDVARDFPR